MVAVGDNPENNGAQQGPIANGSVKQFRVLFHSHVSFGPNSRPDERETVKLGFGSAQLSSTFTLRLSDLQAEFTSTSPLVINRCRNSGPPAMMLAQAARYNGHQGQLQSSPPTSSMHPHLDPADSDDGGPQSPDDLDNDDDQPEVARLGKRKRPISVS